MTQQTGPTGHDEAGGSGPTSEPGTDMTESTDPSATDPAGTDPSATDTAAEPTAAEPTAAEPTSPVDLVEGAAAEADLETAEAAAPTGKAALLAALEQEGEVAADYLEVLLDILDLDGDLDLDVEGERASVAIVGTGLDHLVGPRGATLDALQELTRLAVLQSTGERSRLMLDIGGFRAARRVELVGVATRAVEQVLATGEPERLTAMNPFERKVVHDAVAAHEGVVSESEGEEPSRRVVVRRS